MNRNQTLYRINLVRDLREREFKADRRRRLTLIVGTSCFGLLFLSFVYAALTIWNMEIVLRSEREKLFSLQQEYGKYKETRMTVDKSDIELLDNLQKRGIFWTRKLSAMAKHLPDNYWITGFSFDKGDLQVSGFGYVTHKQEQLLILDAYLNRLRADTSFNDVFRTIFLNTTERKEDAGSNRVAFQFTALAPKAKQP